MARPARRHLPFLLPALVLALGPVARAQDRPKDEDIFGAPDKKPEPERPKTEEPNPKVEEPKPADEPKPGAPPADARDAANLGSRDAAPQLSADTPPDNPLAIGGLFYLRSQSSALEKQDPQNWRLSSPSLLDAYFDARPNRRVRGFVLGRMQFDPTLPPAGGAGPTGAGSLQAAGGTMGAASLNALTGGATRGPVVSLDQMWLRFDIAHTVFVTAGKQHVRWGTARFWTPADFLHFRRRQPLEIFDARTGTTMVKLHLPWEAKGWNFYGYGLTEGVGATPTVGDVAGAGRAEVVLGTGEAGVGALVQRHHKPRIEADFSAGIWDLDFYGEVALRYASEIDRVGYDPTVTIDPTSSQADKLAAVDQRYFVYRESGRKPQAVGGVNYQIKYADKDVLTMGVEYFYNGLGYADANAYPGLIFKSNLVEPASFFYLGKHYAAVFITAPAPFDLDLHNFTLSTIGNLSDHSFITRFDYGLVLLTHLQLEAFVAVHYGKSNGEFRFGLSEPALGVNFNPAILDLGIALRVSI